MLPLAEIAADLDGTKDVGGVLSEHRVQVGSFVLSFVVVWVLWSVHHRTMEYFDGYDGVILRLTLVWLFTSVVLPFVTQLLASEEQLAAAPLSEALWLRIRGRRALPQP